MKSKIAIILSSIILMSCGQEEEVKHSGKCTLVLDLSHENVPQIAITRGAGQELAIQILRPDGSVYLDYASGTVPDKVTLDAGVVYTIKAFSPNQETWHTANDGIGEACYYGETSVSAGEDEVVYCRYQVPMTNYAVTFTLPELFDQLFTSYSLTIHTQNRDVTLHQADIEAYFPVDNQGFTYRLQATNTDGMTYSSTPATYTDIQNGRIYQLCYGYDYSTIISGATIQIHDGM